MLFQISMAEDQRSGADYSWVMDDLLFFKENPTAPSAHCRLCETLLARLAILLECVAWEQQPDAQSTERGHALYSIARELSCMTRDNPVPSVLSRYNGYKYVRDTLILLSQNGMVQTSIRPFCTWQLVGYATLINEIACRLPAKRKFKLLARSLHNIASAIVDLTRRNTELPVPRAAELEHTVRYPGAAYV